MCFGGDDNQGEPEPPARPIPRRRTPNRQEFTSRRPAFIPPISLTKLNISNALKHADQYLHGQRQRFTLVAMGQAVRVLQGNDDSEARNLRFFGAQLHSPQIKMITEAFEYARESTGVSLTGGWMEPDFLRTNGHKVTYYSELAQRSEDSPLFKGRSLEILAVPLEHAFISLASKLGAANEHPKDFENAIEYLHAIRCYHQGKPVPISHIEDRCADYGPTLKLSALRRINAGYRDRYRCDGIKF